MDETRRIGAIGLGVFIVIVIVMLVFTVRSASAANCGDGTGNPCQCGDTVVGDWTFTGDMVCPAGHGLIIGADGITIDGNGFAIIGDRTNCPYCGEGDPEATYCGILNYNATLGGGHDDVIIKNLEIKNFCNGIVIKGAGSEFWDTPADNNTIFECSVHDNGDDATGKVTHGIHLWRATNTTVKDCAVYNNSGFDTDSISTGGHGIKLYGNSDCCNITCNNIYNNTRSGIYSNNQCDHCTIAYNKITDNGAATNYCGGILLMFQATKDCIIEKNNITDTTGPGIFVGGDDCVVRHNTVIGSVNATSRNMNLGNGIFVYSDADNTEIYNNTFCDNKFKDIHNTGTGTLADSNTCGSSDIAGACDWSCGTLVPVYFDFDSDGYYSKDRVGCSCDIVGGRGECACCNPGLFNSSGAAQHCAGGVCIYLNPGTDPNDCDASIIGHEPANDPPVADVLVYDEYNNVGSKHLCKVCFDGSGSYAPDGSITSYEWSFGDGTYGADMICEHIYASWNWNGPDEPGNYYEPFHALLTVTDDEPETNTTHFDVIVHIAGDANGDGVVNIMDASIVGFEWGRSCSPPDTCWRDLPDEWADRADLNNDHEVNILDMVIIGTRWKDTAR